MHSTVCVGKIREIGVVGIKNIEAPPLYTVQLGAN